MKKRSKDLISRRSISGATRLSAGTLGSITAVSKPESRSPRVGIPFGKQGGAKSPAFQGLDPGSYLPPTMGRYGAELAFAADAPRRCCLSA
jgi:hypothetical protein